MTRRKTTVLATLAVALCLSTAAAARAQAPGDPVERAFERVDAALGERARAAETVIEAARHVTEGAAARGRGERAAAAGALERAERIAESAGKDSALVEELARVIAAEREALDPKPEARSEAAAHVRIPAIALSRSALARLSSYRGSLGPILMEERVPVELLAVAHVESGFSPTALSPKGARGIWQFMPSTARRYGLAVDGLVDERTHPEHSTRAAARYLRDLYAQFGDWKLALAAYNAGEGRVWSVIRRTGVRDFDEMARRGLLPAETIRYVPKVMALWSRAVGPARAKEK
jgi:hypothetical protein